MAEIKGSFDRIQAESGTKGALAALIVHRLCELAGEASMCWEKPEGAGTFLAEAAGKAAEGAALDVGGLLAADVDRLEERVRVLEAAAQAACCAGCGKILASREEALEHVVGCAAHPAGHRVLEAEEQLARFKEDTREVFERLCDLAEARAGVDLGGLDPVEQRLAALIEGLVLRVAELERVAASPPPPAPRVVGPDECGLLWIHGETGEIKGAISVHVDTIYGRAFLGYVAKPAPGVGL